ncbi:hypothetical protein CBR_g48431 [Chara braunii]|uniref:Major facilitator superfamily (MFS) profile domain-containing protein n=1 Tax=Chara braunii TaxID=69332 RepID=A0A388M2Q0_CHABU|nr:hypothetical protein CBR_g48431 [Chara braunii]|eukprot:GBG88816.1 hypothetical protein CBR_g48431 [Chara braunii]
MDANPGIGGDPYRRGCQIDGDTGGRDWNVSNHGALTWSKRKKSGEGGGDVFEVDGWDVTGTDTGEKVEEKEDFCGIAQEQGGGASTEEEETESEAVMTVDDAINAIGFGRFQMALFVFAGLAWMGEATEATIMSFVGPAAQSEWGLAAGEQGLLATAVFAGMMIGSYTWGTVADVLGRKRTLIGSASLLLFAAVVSALSPSYWFLAGSRALVGVGLAGGPVLFALFMEFLPTVDRGFWLVAVAGFWTVGSVLVALLAWAVMPSLGWRWLLAFSAIPTGMVLGLSPFVPESPRFLIGRPEGSSRALQILTRIARVNGKELPNGLSLVPSKNAPLQQSHQSEPYGEGGKAGEGGEGGEVTGASTNMVPKVVRSKQKLPGTVTDSCELRRSGSGTSCTQISSETNEGYCTPGVEDMIEQGRAQPVLNALSPLQATGHRPERGVGTRVREPDATGKAPADSTYIMSKSFSGQTDTSSTEFATHPRATPYYDQVMAPALKEEEEPFDDKLGLEEQLLLQLDSNGGGDGNERGVAQGANKWTSTVAVLFSSGVRRTTLILWPIFFANAFTYYGLILITSQLAGIGAPAADAVHCNEPAKHQWAAGNLDFHSSIQIAPHQGLGAVPNGAGMQPLSGIYGFAESATAAPALHGVDANSRGERGKELIRCAASIQRSSLSDEPSGNGGDQGYRDVVISSLGELPGLLIAAVAVRTVGRKQVMMSMFAASTFSLLPLIGTSGSLRPSLVALYLFFARGAIMGCFTVAYLYAPEVYPSRARTTGLSIANGFARIGGLVCPFVAVELVRTCHLQLALILLAAVPGLAAIGVYFLPLETKGRAIN